MLCWVGASAGGCIQYREQLVVVRWKNRNGNAMIAGARLPRGARAGDGPIFHVTAECHQQQVFKNIFSAARIITDFVMSSWL